VIGIQKREEIMMISRWSALAIAMSITVAACGSDVKDTTADPVASVVDVMLQNNLVIGAHIPGLDFARVSNPPAGILDYDWFFIEWSVTGTGFTTESDAQVTFTVKYWLVVPDTANGSTYSRGDLLCEISGPGTASEIPGFALTKRVRFDIDAQTNTCGVRPLGQTIHVVDVLDEHATCASTTIGCSDPVDMGHLIGIWRAATEADVAKTFTESGGWWTTNGPWGNANEVCGQRANQANDTGDPWACQPSCPQSRATECWWADYTEDPVPIGLRPQNPQISQRDASTFS